MCNLNIRVLPTAKRQQSMMSIYKINFMPSLLSVQVSQFSTFSSFNFFSRSTILPQFSSSTIPINRLQLHSLLISPSPSPSPAPSPLEISSNGRSFEVSYLINTFGWPPDVAISRAKNLKFKNPVKPDRVLAFLKRHKFTDSDISILVTRLPAILVSYPEKTLLPRFGFLSSIGLSTTDIIDVFIKAPIIIVRCLENIIIPNFNLLCSLFNSYDEAVKFVKRSPKFLAQLIKLDMQILLEAGVPVENILDFMSIDRYRYKIPNPDNLRKMVEQVRKMGFDPCSSRFLHTLVSMMVLSKSTWEDKVQVFKKYGCSDHEISFAFKKLPYFILASKDKVEGVMDFLVNTMGIEATEVFNFPRIFSLSLEKKIIPRCLVYLSILEKGLCREFGIQMLDISEAKFITMFIKRYENEAPELWDLYKGLMKLHRLSLSSPSPSPFSVFENSSNEHSFKVSYLMSRFGWPPELAVVKSKRLRFKTLEIPDRILAFLKNHGFTKTQISVVVKKRPTLLGILDPEKVLMPKFEFLSSIGLSTTEIFSVVTKAPEILERSLEKVTIPTFEILCNLVNSDEEAVKMIKRYPNILRTYLEADNIQTLLNAGVPAANIIAFLSSRTSHFTPRTPDNFRKMVEEIKEMGFDPCLMKFLEALRGIKLTSKSIWEGKVRVLKKHGWSDRDILLALEKCPVFICTSANKIERVMGFLANKMGFEARDISNCPSVFKLSLEKHIIPRSLVYKSLMEKGLLKKKLSLAYVLKSTKSTFLARFIMPYEDEVPELWDIYNGKIKEWSMNSAEHT